MTNNPVNLVDATGLNGIGGPHPILGDKYDDEVPSASKVPVPPGYADDFVDHRDLTIWLVGELSVNAQSPEVSQMRRYMTAISKDCPFCVAYAGVQWIRRVADRHVWDFKHAIERKLATNVIMLRHTGEDYGWYHYDVPGNVHYAYVGRAAGWSAQDLHEGAAWAEMFDPGHRKKGELNSCYISPIPCNYCPLLKVFRNPEWEDFGYDDPEDWNSVEFGIQLYERHPVGLTLGQFRRFLSAHGWMLRLYEEPPAVVEPLPAQEDWPYWRGYFNGWRTDVSPFGWPYY